MSTEPGRPDQSRGLDRRHASAALRVSALSVAWTVASSVLAVTIGIRGHAGVLVAFGGVGFVDAIGSVALVQHFRHGLRHDQLSDDRERLAHRIVLVGLLVLSARKQQTARRISSAALASDGHLSAVGATLAGVTLAGTAVTRWLGWHWTDAVATILIGGAAACLAITTWRRESAADR